MARFQLRTELTRIRRWADCHSRFAPSLMGTPDGGFFHVIPVRLSDLGYALHESVDGLFFKDTLDDDQRFDPVFIAGFP